MSAPGNRFDFRTLGGLDLRDASGSKVSVVLAHAKRTALLAYLAVARPHGFHRRDTLVALLWPELDQERARASLRKAVHHLRLALGADAIIGNGDEELALDIGRVDCDAATFDQLITTDAATALERYHGHFLNGFFVPDASEFERWMELERGRLRDAAFAGAWKLAEQEAATGNSFGAAHWARHAAALLPDDEGALRRLITLLHQLGDRAGAVSAYEEFARRLKQDFDVEPSAETRELMRQVRRKSLESIGIATESIADPVADTTSPALPDRGAAPPRTATPMSTRRRVIIGALVALAASILWRTEHTTTDAAATPTTSVAVLPFSFRGGDDYRYLGDGIASLLATSLDGAGGLHGIDPSSFLASMSPSERATLDPSHAAVLAQRAGAGMYVSGEIVEVSGRLRVSAALHRAAYEAAYKEPLARATAEDTSTKLFALVDRIAAQLLTGQSREPTTRFTRVAAVTTHSLPALKEYLEGERYFRAGHYKEAVSSFQRAADEDSTFALAHYRLASAYGWSSDTLARPAAQAAIRHARNLSAPDRRLVEAFLPYLSGEADEAERRYREILSTRPYEGEAWYPLGEVLFHFNPMRGRSITEARPIFERALGMGPTDSPLTHLLEIAAIERRYAEFDSLLTGIAPGAHFDLVGRLIRAFTKGDARAQAGMIAEVRATSDGDIANTARHMLFLVEDREHAKQVVRLLLEPQRPREVRSLGHVLRAHLEMAAGRIRATDLALVAAEQLDRDRALEHRGLLFSLPFLTQTPALRDSVFATLERWTATSPGMPNLVFSGDQQLHPHFRGYLLGLLAAASGRHDVAQRHAADIESMPAPAHVQQLPRALAHGVRARVAWEQGRHQGALSSLRLARSDEAPADLLGIVPFYGLPQERFLHGEVLRALGRLEEAHGWFSAFDEHSAWGRVYLAPAHFRSAEIDERLGRRDEAASHYARFAALWKDADPELQSFVAEAQARLRRLQAEPRR